MLFILTGDVQIGKTRWLQRLAGELAERGVPTFGVIAPGRWVPKANPAPGEDPFDKLGIDNVLLPDGRTVPFAVRADLAQRDGSFDEGSQSAKAELAWHISDEAIEQVNAHFAHELEEWGSKGGDQDESDARGAATANDGRNAERQCDPPKAAANESSPTAGNEAAAPAVPGLLIVDELGRLELMHGGGLVNAMALLDRGPTPQFPCALIVVRDYLLDQAKERFEPVWGPARTIAPDDESLDRVMAAIAEKDGSAS